LKSGAPSSANVEILGGDRRAVAAGGQHDPPEPGPDIRQVRGESEDRHDLGRDRDDEARLAGVAVLFDAQADDDLAQGAVADVDHAWPQHGAGVDPG
jgi:hypothetical protein